MESIAEVVFMSKPVIVGYDGSRASDLAVVWAAQAATSRHLPLKVITAWTLPATEVGVGAGAAFDHQRLDAMREESHVILEKGGSLASDTAGDITVSGEVASGPAAGVLVRKSDEAAMMVLGSQGRGGLAGLFLGSVSRQVAAHVECPAIIVRPAQDPSSREVVVGVDGSKSSLNALEFAFQEASRRAYSVRVLHTWEVPPIGAITGVPTFAPPEMLKNLAGAEMRITSEALAGYQEQYPDVSAKQEVLRGSPVKALREASEKAAMVVVGSRGRGGFTGLLLGSVSHAIAHNGKCTTAVVH
jgi:nucleotide-binding universal stress UspA family protein